METFAQILIYIHAGFGGLALLTGGAALVVKKGGFVHKKSGKIFYYSMLLSVILALIVSVLPKHESPFLFSIGVFSSYFIIGGYRSLRFKRQEFDHTFDKILAWLIIIIGIVMIFYPLLLNGNINIVLFVFGIFGFIFGIRDLQLFKKPERLRKGWLKLHLGKMTGGYIAAVTAFFVVNEILPGIYNWFAPALVGNVFIFYWFRRLRPK